MIDSHTPWELHSYSAIVIQLYNTTSNILKLNRIILGGAFGYYIQFSCSVVSNSLWPHGLQHARPPCPSPSPGGCSNSCPSSRWCHRTISSSVVPFSFRLQSFLASGSFQRVSSLHQVAKILEFQLQHQSLRWIFRSHFFYDGLVGSPCCPRDSQESSPTPQFKKHQFFGTQLSSQSNEVPFHASQNGCYPKVYKQ